MLSFLATSKLLAPFIAVALLQVQNESQATENSIFLGFCFVAVVGVLANAYLVSVVRSQPKELSSRVLQKARWYELDAIRTETFSMWFLALWSFLALFLELLMIRWISSEIRIFAYFKNFVLIACYLGFGLGCYLCRRKVNLLLLLVPIAVLTTMVSLPWKGLRTAVTQISAFVGASSGMQVWGLPSFTNVSMAVVALAMIVPIFGLITFTFVPLGQIIGSFLENAKDGVAAYSANVAASLLGILVYTFLCFLSQPPAVWLLVSGALLLLLLWKARPLRWAAVLVFGFCMALTSLPKNKDVQVFWSPYQKLTLISDHGPGQVLSYSLNTNDSWYQQILDLSDSFVHAHPELFRDTPIEWNAYNIPYHFYPKPPSVLILGSGMGNDVAAALRNGAGRVTAVEIDPMIIQLGQKYHFEKPYSSPRVRTVQDDARSYIENTRDHFDLIVFSLLDSHTTSSYFTNIRIDNYVYTSEALRAARRLLAPDGIFIVKFQVNTPWIAGRLYKTLQEVFQAPPVQLETPASPYSTGGRFFVTGSQSSLAQALKEPGLAAYIQEHGKLEMVPASVTTDDWPYFYQYRRGVPLPVIIISAVLVVLGLALVRDTGTPLRSLRWHFFFLGAGFLLLEAQIISKMALLFGTTWLVNSIVISGLLLLILLANLLVKLRPAFPVSWAYAGLFATLLLGLVIPIERIFFPSISVRILLASAVFCTPVFFAGIVFIQSYAEANFSSEALGSNLLGALVGGILESVSLWTGIRSLLILAALLYLASLLTLSGRRAGRRSSEAATASPVSV